MVRNYLLLLVASVMVLGGCSQPAQPNFVISLNPTSASVNPGQSASTTLTITPQNGFSGTVNLSLQSPPTGVTVSPASVTLAGSSPQNFTLSFATTGATPVQVHNLTLVASQGSLSKTASFALTVTDFGVALSRTSTLRAQGQSFSDLNLTLTPEGGFSGPVALSLQSPPSGISLSPASLSASGPITLSVGRDVPDGVHDLTLRASSGGASKTLSLSLRVLPIQTVAAGGYFSAAIKPNGEAWSWGNNTYGQLGRVTGASDNTPAQVTDLSGVVSLSLGEYHTLVLREDGSVRAFGRDDHGQLGDGPDDSSGTNSNIKIVTPSLPDGAKAVAVEAGRYYSLALLSDGTVYAWGQNDVGQLGIGNTDSPKNAPGLIEGLDNVIALAAGDDHTLALKADGSIWAWGDNPNGELGTGDNNRYTNPVQLSSITATAIAAGGNHSVALLSGGTVWTWGYNNHGQLGDGSTTSRNTPLELTGLPKVSKIAAGYEFTLALLEDGSVKSWGDDASFQLGNGTTTGDQTTPVDVLGIPPGRTVRGLSAGIFHALAVLDDGTMLAWGSNVEGQLGDGTNNSSEEAKPVSITGVQVPPVPSP